MSLVLNNYNLGAYSILVPKDYQLRTTVECYPSQLNQVVMNIVANAIDALESVEQPKITLSTRLCTDRLSTDRCDTEVAADLSCTEAADDLIDARAGARADAQGERLKNDETSRFAVITIADNGPGIPLDIQERIFDPFFTTKVVGKGTGMGLSISYKIVTEKHSGELTVRSTPEQGTQFTIKLPLTQAAYRQDEP